MTTSSLNIFYIEKYGLVIWLYWIAYTINRDWYDYFNGQSDFILQNYCNQIFPDNRYILCSFFIIFFFAIARHFLSQTNQYSPFYHPPLRVIKLMKMVLTEMKSMHPFFHFCSSGMYSKNHLQLLMWGGTSFNELCRRLMASWESLISSQTKPLVPPLQSEIFCLISYWIRLLLSCPLLLLKLIHPHSLNLRRSELTSLSSHSPSK